MEEQKWKGKGVEYFILSALSGEVHERVRCGSGGDGGRRRRRQRPLLALCVYSRERESLARREGGPPRAEGKREGSSHRSSLARRPVIL